MLTFMYFFVSLGYIILVVAKVDHVNRRIIFPNSL